MPKTSTKAKAAKRNLKVADLPKSQQKLGNKEMKTVKGGAGSNKKPISPCFITPCV